jgi:hypothetical protein
MIISKQLRHQLESPLLDLEELGIRWRCHRMTALRRANQLGLKPMRLSKRRLLFRVSDVERVEAECQ